MQSEHNIQTIHGVLNIQHWTSTKGVPVYFVRAPNLPMFDVQLLFEAGSARDPEQKGLAYLTNRLLNAGTKLFTTDELANTFEEQGAEFSVSSYRDMATVSLRSLNQPDILEKMIDTLAQVISQSTFLEKALQRIQARILTSLQYEEQRPDKIAEKLFFSQLYEHHPYANWVRGDAHSVAQLTSQTVESFYKQYYVVQNAKLVIVGALTFEQAYAMAETLSGALSEGAPAECLPAVPQRLFSAPVKKDFPAEQMHIMMGTLGIKRGDPDFFALSLGNHILGGNSTVTRIFNEIRHKRGLAYDVYSYIMPMKVKGPFIIGMQTKATQAPEALDILQSTLREFINSGPSVAEVEEAKLNILGGYPLLFDSNKAILANLTMLAFYNFPLHYFDEYKNKIAAVTVDAIQTVFKERIHPDNMLTVMVGP